MKIEAIDLFYISLPKITRTADGTQDSLVVRVRTDNGLEGWGECDASPLVSMTAYVMPMSHSNVINIREALLGETIDSPEGKFTYLLLDRNRSLEIIPARCNRNLIEVHITPRP